MNTRGWSYLGAVVRSLILAAGILLLTAGSASAQSECGGASSCPSCTAMDGCGWCNGQCLSGTQAGGGACTSAAGNWAWVPGQCAGATAPRPPATPQPPSGQPSAPSGTCGRATTCSACASQDGCGWCNGQCLSGTQAGGGACTSAAGNWAWVPSQCAGATAPRPPATPQPPSGQPSAPSAPSAPSGTCGRATTCSACASQDGCGWCNGQCLSGTQAGGGACTSAAGNWAWVPGQCAGATAPQPRPETPAPAPSADAPASVASAFVAAHNRYRADHCAPPLTWSPAVAASAQRWADRLRQAGCGMQHSSSSERSGYGESLFGGSGSYTPEQAVEAWYSEVGQYNYGRPGFSGSTGHFTQVVWRATTSVGCASATCSGSILWVCQYSPAGNMAGQFPANVSPRGCQ
ncbi:MAG: hypothetical protein HY909_26460 [Deltaproteobacteria bacterium]|nr:hypothetical protein [Deltaproteobacteria bacterium]